MNNVVKLWGLLVPAEKWAAVWLLLLMLVGMAFEMLGVGLVVPALAAMAIDRPAVPSPTVARWLHWLGEPSRSQLVMAGLVALLLVYAIKTAFLLFVNWRMLRFGEAFNNRLGRTLFTTYLGQPWTFHLQRNSAELVRSFNDASHVATLVTGTLGALADCLVALGILGLLLWFEPVGAVAVGVLVLGGTWLLDRVTRQRTQRWGQLVHEHQALTGKHLTQGLHGAKDVKIFGRERAFIEQFSHHRAMSVQMSQRHAFFGGLPRLWYEWLAVSGLCTLAAVMVWQGIETRAMIPTLGLFAASAFRLLPLVNRLANTLQTLRFSGPPIDAMRSELALGTHSIPEVSEPMEFRDAIALKNVCYRYPGAHANAVEDVSIDIPRGAAVGIIGGSGAGKSTLIDVILGLLTPTSGHVTVDGIDISTNVRGWQCQIGYVPQSIYLCDDTIRGNVAFGVPEEKVDEAAVRRAIRAAQLEGFIDELPEGLATLVGERGVRLSGGQRQRIGIARALYHDPQVLVLDEATSALDAETERGFMQDVQALQGTKTMLIIAHRLTTVAGCDVLYRLERGRVVATGSYAELVTSLPGGVDVVGSRIAGDATP